MATKKIIFKKLIYIKSILAYWIVKGTAQIPSNEISNR